MPSLLEALVGYSDWLGYGHGERADAWLARLEVNRPELEAFRALPAADAQPYAARAHALAPPRGVEAPAPPRADAREALDRARSAADLHAFTWTPDAIAAPGRGFLAGVPVAIKDLMAVAGAPLSGGTRALERRVAPTDAECVARLKRAGAVVIGLANLHELAYGITSDNPHFGRVVNPAARDRIPGGSSGGSGAAIAAGIVRAALGTDTAGSIRIPAACCGIVGFKPSYDAVPRAGVIDLAPTLDHVGPMGRSVEDCAALFAALLGMDAIPAWTRGDLREVTVARLGGYFADPLDAEVRAMVDAACAAVREDGGRIVARDIEGIGNAPALQFNTIAPEATAVHAERLRTAGDRMGEDVRVRLEIGHFLPGPWYVKAQRLRAVLVRAIDAALDEADVLVCPTLRTPAPAIGAARVAIGARDYPLHTAVTQLTLPFNLAGLPAVSLPWGRSSAGVPLALQVVGARGDDWATLAIAQRLQARAPAPDARFAA